MDNQTRQVVKTHLALYPGMEAQDCIKLLYQGEMGAGHLLCGCEHECGNAPAPTGGEAIFTARLAQEMALPSLLQGGPTPPQPVGGGLCRVHLSSVGLGLTAQTLAKLCVLSAADVQGSEEQLRQKLLSLQELIAQGALPLPPREAGAVADYLAQTPLKQPRHSQRYRALYQPHYRLLLANMALFLPVFAAVDAALAESTHVLVGVDGMCASGKSSLAALLQRVYGCGVVHADDFFLRPAQRGAARLAEDGGNIDYERLGPVAAQAAEDTAFTYRRYNCATGQLEDECAVPAGRLTVLEGAYALHPKVGARCSVRVFLSVDAQVQAQRVLARSGAALAGRFAAEWVPMENRYFRAFHVREGCDIVLDTTPLGENNFA